jgi:hypothetical protein
MVLQGGLGHAVDLREPRQVWAESGQHHDVVDRVELLTVEGLQHHPPSLGALHGGGAEPGHRLDKPGLAAAFARIPNAARAGSWSASPPPNTAPVAPRRSIHTIWVPGSSFAISASATSAVKAKCPLPATAIRLPA